MDETERTVLIRVDGLPIRLWLPPEIMRRLARLRREVDAQAKPVPHVENESNQ